MGCIYTGFKHNHSVNGAFKVGKTEKKKPTTRLTANDLTGLMYFYAPDASPNDLLLLESVARSTAERINELSPYRIDWFAYRMKGGNKYAEVAPFAITVMEAVKNMADTMGIKGQVYQYPWVA